MIATTCPKCGKRWDESMDLLDLFNHQTVHRWIDADFKGRTEWSIRQSSLTHEQRVERMMAWALDEAEWVADHMKVTA